jgi:hypothetical protein
MHVVREATEGDGEGREERKRHDVDGARHGERGKEEAKRIAEAAHRLQLSPHATFIYKTVLADARMRGP